MAALDKRPRGFVYAFVVAAPPAPEFVYAD